MITLEQYFGKWINHPDATAPIKANAKKMLNKVNDLLAYLEENGVVSKVNPVTQSQVGGQSNGGFRPKVSTVGAPKSAHKEGLAVDVYDPDGALDRFITSQPEVLEKFDLYREAPEDTPTWLHLQDRKTKSGKRTFKP